MTLLEEVVKQFTSSSSSKSVFERGSLEITSVKTSTSPKPALIVAPVTKGKYPVVLFLHGFLLRNTFYQQLLDHIASHGFVLVAPQIYEFPCISSGPQEIQSAADVTNWLETGLQPLLPEDVEPDFTKVALSGHSRGGKAAFALALGYAKTSLSFSALVGIDPVAGAAKWAQTEPHILTYEPRSFDLSIPVAVIGTGLGPDQGGCLGPPCAPEGLSHKEFFDECRPPCAHFVAEKYGHMDMLDDKPPGVIGGLSGCMCKSGSGPRDDMRRCTGGLVVAFLRAFLDGESEDLEAIVDDPSLSPATLGPVVFLRS